MSEELSALHASVERLQRIVDGLEPAQLRRQAYPTEWTVADVLSHLGSGAVILRQRFEDIVHGRQTGEDLNQATWDEWNAKTPDDQAADALMADQSLVSSLAALGDDRRDEFRLAMGPFDLDFDGFVGLRLNEHVVHTWDIEVVLDPAAVLPDTAARLMIDNLSTIAGFAGRPVGRTETLHVRTSDPSRDFTVGLSTDSVTLAGSEPVADPELDLPSEAFIRLVYGRLDPEHTPGTVVGAALDTLRRTFPGF